MSDSRAVVGIRIAAKLANQVGRDRKRPAARASVSMGFTMSTLTPEREGAVFVRRWQPFELSLCALPKCLDAHVKVRGLSHEDARACGASRPPCVRCSA